MSIERLNKITNETLAYKDALKRGPRAEITIKEMADSFIQNRDAPAVEQVKPEKIMRTQTGRPVQVKSWLPGNK